MSHQHLTPAQIEEERRCVRELSGCGIPPAHIGKALRISQAEVLAYIADNRSRKQAADSGGEQDG